VWGAGLLVPEKDESPLHLCSLTGHPLECKDVVPIRVRVAQFAGLMAHEKDESLLPLCGLGAHSVETKESCSRLRGDRKRTISLQIR
jgi:hypothetical protein